jgi:hypothetical protein
VPLSLLSRLKKLPPQQQPGLRRSQLQLQTQPQPLQRARLPLAPPRLQPTPLLLTLASLLQQQHVPALQALQQRRQRASLLRCSARPQQPLLLLFALALGPLTLLVQVLQALQARRRLQEQWKLSLRLPRLLVLLSAPAALQAATAKTLRLRQLHCWTACSSGSSQVFRS